MSTLSTVLGHVMGPQQRMPQLESVSLVCGVFFLRSECFLFCFVLFCFNLFHNTLFQRVLLGSDYKFYVRQTVCVL